MEMIVLHKDARAVAGRWRWRNRAGEFILPEDMRTGHLFNTLCMIWNHTMPASAATHAYIPHTFGPIYTPKYLRAAILPLTAELAKRTDRTDLQEIRLQFMINWLATNQLEGVNKHVCLN